MRRSLAFARSARIFSSFSLILPPCLLFRDSTESQQVTIPVTGMDVGILDGVAGRNHHAIAHIDAHMACAGGVIGALKENQVTGFCLCLRDFRGLLPQA